MRSVRVMPGRVLTIGIIGLLLALGSVVSARSLGTLKWPGGSAWLSVLDANLKVALRAIEALDARTRIEHEQLLQDTQSLADEAGSLVRENAERVAQIAALKTEIAALRADVAALKRAPRRAAARGSGGRFEAATGNGTLLTSMPIHVR